MIEMLEITTGIDSSMVLAAVFMSSTSLTFSVPVSYQQPTSPYITHTKYDIWWWENEN